MRQQALCVDIVSNPGTERDGGTDNFHAAVADCRESRSAQARGSNAAHGTTLSVRAVTVRTPSPLPEASRSWLVFLGLGYKSGLTALKYREIDAQNGSDLPPAGQTRPCPSPFVANSMVGQTPSVGLSLISPPELWCFFFFFGFSQISAPKSLHVPATAMLA